MRHLLLVGVGNMGQPYLTAARHLGVMVTAVELPERCDRLAGQAHRVVRCEDRSDEGWAAAAQQAAAAQRFDAVLAFSEPHVLGAAMVQDRLGLPGPSLHAAAASRNKAVQRGIFAAAGLPQPEFRIAGPQSPLDELTAWAAARLPIVIKPIDRAGSIGVVQVSSVAEVRAALVGRAGRTIVLEQALTGQEFSWEGFIRDGEITFGNITHKETTGPPNFVEVCHRVPGLGATPSGPDTAAVRAALDGLAARVAGALGMRTGIVHLEVMLTANGPAIIEVAVRTPGDRIMDLLQLAYGFDPFETLVALALGDPVSGLPRTPSAHAASWFPTHRAGRVRQVHGLTEIRSCPAAIREELHVQPDDVLGEPASSADRIGYVLFQARSAAELSAAMRRCRGAFTLDTDPVVAGPRDVVPT